MIRILHRGNFNNIERFFKRVQGNSIESILRKYGEAGVQALASMTPTETGLTAASWDYEIEISSSVATIYWTNSNENKGVNIAIILQYGHGTGTGGYFSGVDYVNPAIEPVFQQLADDAWKEVTK